MGVDAITIICITVLVIAAIAGKCYMEHIALETRKIRSKAGPQQKNLDNVPYTCENIWKKK
jgi:hypothetical protein